MRIGRKGAGQNLQQRALSGSIASNHPKGRPARHRERDVAQSGHAVLLLPAACPAWAGIEESARQPMPNRTGALINLRQSHHLNCARQTANSRGTEIGMGYGNHSHGYTPNRWRYQEKKRATGFPVALCGVISVNNYQITASERGLDSCSVRDRFRSQSESCCSDRRSGSAC